MNEILENCATGAAKEIEDFVASYENPSVGEQAALAAIKILAANLKITDYPDRMLEAYRAQHILHAFEGLLARRSDNYKGLVDIFGKIK
jgi:hypothetical protein